MGHPVERSGPAKILPEGATQHTTAGPYSPVLQVAPGQLVVVSGQASLDENGNIVGQNDGRADSAYPEKLPTTARNCGVYYARRIQSHCVS